jgi:hypothetical protein
MVRTHPDPPDAQAVADALPIRGFSSAGRAPALQAGGRRFDPDNLHQYFSFGIRVQRQMYRDAFVFDRLINWLFDL